MDCHSFFEISSLNLFPFRYDTEILVKRQFVSPNNEPQSAAVTKVTSTLILRRDNFASFIFQTEVAFTALMSRTSLRAPSEGRGPWVVWRRQRPRPRRGVWWAVLGCPGRGAEGGLPGGEGVCRGMR